MRTYTVVLPRPLSVVETFIGNGDELTPAEEASLKARLSKLGYALFVRSVEPVTELEGFVCDEEQQSRKGG